jgi:AraC family ethanolamine operon transcriptional activator
VRYAATNRYQGVTLKDLCRVAGASERRVRHAFHECHGVSPTTYLRQAALLQVRRRLLDGAGLPDAVTRAAADYGFWHLSRFAGQYRALFGESPSATVARARGLHATRRSPHPLWAPRVLGSIAISSGPGDDTTRGAVRS